MAGLAGIPDLLLQRMNWRLTSQDDGQVIKGQFPPLGLNHTVSANYAEVGTLGRDQPILQFDGDELEVLEFTARVWARNQVDGVRRQINELKNAVRRDKDLNRPKVWEFTAGRHLSLTCVVQSVGQVRYDRLRPDGSYRGATFKIRLLRYEPYDATLSGQDAESLVLPFRSNESFEGLALRVYGDPNAGEPLRRRNPEIVVPEAGDLVHLPPKRALTVGFKLEPASTALAPTSRQERAQREHFRRRGRTYRSHVLGAEWS